MSLLPGDIVRLRWPHTNYAESKSRPALVLDVPDARNDVFLCMITTADHHESCIAIAPTDYTSEATLGKSSWLRPDRTLKVEASLLQRLAPRLSLSLVNKVQKASILANTRKFSTLAHAANRPGWDKDLPSTSPSWQPGQTIPYAGRVFTEDEVEAAVSSTLDFWLTLGPEGEAMEKELAAFLGVKHTLLVNSGSSANLVAISALTTHKLPDHKRIKPGDEVITVAAGFPTTVAPILQVGAVPVFIDANPITGNADCSQLEAAYAPGKTKAVMMAHALGNPFDLATTLAFCQKYDLWLIEDNCDALGCTYTLPLKKAKSLGLDHLIKIAEKGEHQLIRIHKSSATSSAQKRSFGVSEARVSERAKDHELCSESSSETPPSLLLTAPTGSFGDISTQSFYPPHHLTMGEGGAVNIIRRPALKTYAESFRDWGRDCWCPSGKDDTCKKRFQWQLGELPEGYDHKYIYSHLGYNLKPLDPQAAIGRVQLKKLPAFIEARKRNWERLRQGLVGLEEFIDFALPTHATGWMPPLKRSFGVSEARVSERAKDHELCSESSSETPSSETPPSSFSWDSSQCRTDCSWFGFMMTIKESAPFTRTDLAKELDDKKIGNRMLFGGNLVRQPAFVQLRHDNPNAFRVVSVSEESFRISEARVSEGAKDHERCSGSSTETPSSGLRNSSSPLPGADRIMNHTIFLGTYPGLTKDQIDYMAKVIRDFVQEKAAQALK